MRAPVRWLRDLVEFTLPVEDLAERLSVAGLEVNGIDELPDGDRVLDLEVLPNMARCLAMQGVAREVAAVTGAPLRIDVDLHDLPQPDPDLAPSILEPSLCRRFAALVIDGVDGGRETPSWLRERLVAAGVSTVSGLVDLANYVMLEVGQPLHAYDLEQLGSPKLGVRAARANETLQLLSQPEGTQAAALPVGSPVIVDRDDQPVAVAGVVGGRPTAVSESTSSIVVEAASFDFIAIRRTQTALGLVTDASARFSRGVDPALVETGLRRFCALLREVNPNFRIRALGEARVGQRAERTVRLDVDDLNRTIGATYQPDEVTAVLERLGLSWQRAGTVVAVTVGDERADLQIPQDLMEEVVRIDGLDRLPATMPEDAIPPTQRNVFREGQNALREAMVRAGLTEIITYTLSSPDAHAALGGPADGALLPLLNPLSPDRAVVRRSLLPGVLANLEENLRYTPSAHVFEQGVVVHPEREGSDPGLPGEEQRMAFAIVGDAEPHALWSDGGRPLDFYDAADIVLGLAHNLRIDGVGLVAAEAEPYLQSACAAVRKDDTVLGHIGLVSETVAARFGLAGRRVFAGELDADTLTRLRRTDFRVHEPSRYPSVRLDLSVVVPADIAIGDLLNEAATAGGAELSDVSVFDVFTGPGVPTGHKAIGLRLTINAGDRTLTTREAEAVRECVMERFHNLFAAQRR